MRQLFDSESTLEIGETIVVAEIDHLVKPGTQGFALSMVGRDPMIPEGAHPLGQNRVIRRNHSTFAGGDVLHRMKTKSAQIGERANWPALITRADRMTGIGDDT